MKNRTYYGLLLAAMSIMPCGATFICVDTSPGTGAPPATLGGYTMQALLNEARPELTMVTDVGMPDAGNLIFSNPLEIDHVGGPYWSTWSNGYAGSVYQNYTSELSLLFPANIQAFYMYVEPNIRSSFEFQFTSGDASTTLDIDGDAMAQYIGFYISDPGSSLTSVNILQTTDLSGGFAIGEFGVNTGSISAVPETGGTFTLMSCTLASGLLIRTRQHRRKDK